MKVLEITVGASCSGKTTYAEKQAVDTGIINVNRDDLRKSLFGVKKLADYVFSRHKEDLVTKAQVAMVDATLAAGKSVIVSDTNLDPDRWDVWKDLAKKHNARFVTTFFPLPLVELMKRNIKREFSVPEFVLRSHVERFEKNFPNEVDYWKPVPYTEPADDVCAPYAYIVDVDGTLAHMDGKRGPFEWHKVGGDSIDSSVVRTIRSLQLHHKIIVMSGRDECCREETANWLHDAGINYDMLLMRKMDDYRPDTKIKDELFEEYIAGKFNVIAAFDDRNVVVQMWRDKGIKCYQVALGDF